jgi:hypothetical protein
MYVCFLVLYVCFLFRVFCFSVLFCVLFLLLCCLFTIFVHVYQALPPGGNPIAAYKYKIIYILIVPHKVTPNFSVLLERVLAPELIPKIPCKFETRNSIAVLTTARQLSLSQARTIQCTSSHRLP